MSEQTGEITLLLDPDNVEAQCLETIKQARNAGHALAALIALQSFIAATTHPSHRFTPAYETVKAVVEKHTAGIRMRVLADNAEALAEAMRQKNRQEIAHIHAALSRNGFWQAAQQAISRLKTDDFSNASAWAKAWCCEAKELAQAASGFPDALDFKKAGIAATEYAAMMEIGNYFADAVRQTTK
ncbi:MAG: hypothetical protein PHG47_09405 [Sulfuricella sp.]|nr:hypothetical protein [Sulfuricella sp.]